MIKQPDSSDDFPLLRMERWISYLKIVRKSGFGIYAMRQLIPLPVIISSIFSIMFVLSWFLLKQRSKMNWIVLDWYDFFLIPLLVCMAYFIIWVSGRTLLFWNLDYAWSKNLTSTEKRILLGATSRCIISSLRWRFREDASFFIIRQALKRLFFLSVDSGLDKVSVQNKKEVDKQEKLEKKNYSTNNDAVNHNMNQQNIFEFNIYNLLFWGYAPVIVPGIMLMLSPVFITFFSNSLELSKQIMATSATSWAGWTLSYHLYFWMYQLADFHNQMRQPFVLFDVPNLNDIGIIHVAEVSQLRQYFTGTILVFISFCLFTMPAAYITWISGFIP